MPKSNLQIKKIRNICLNKLENIFRENDEATKAGENSDENGSK